MNFHFKNGCKNELKDNNEKSCSWSRNRISQIIDFEAVWLRNGHAASVRNCRQPIVVSDEKLPGVIILIYLKIIPIFYGLYDIGFFCF